MTPKDVTQPRDKDGALNLLNCLTIKRENNPSNIETSKVKIIIGYSLYVSNHATRYEMTSFKRQSFLMVESGDLVSNLMRV